MWFDLLTTTETTRTKKPLTLLKRERVEKQFHFHFMSDRNQTSFIWQKKKGRLHIIQSHALVEHDPFLSF